MTSKPYSITSSTCKGTPLGKHLMVLRNGRLSCVVIPRPHTPHERGVRGVGSGYVMFELDNI